MRPGEQKFREALRRHARNKERRRRAEVLEQRMAKAVYTDDEYRHPESRKQEGIILPPSFLVKMVLIGVGFVSLLLGVDQGALKLIEIFVK